MSSLFDKHPRPWTLVEGTDFAIYDANQNIVCHCDLSGQAMLITMINADAPQPIKPGFYWVSNGRRGNVIEIKSEKEAEIHRLNGFTIGRYIGDTFEP